jgi:hypothetical protein
LKQSRALSTESGRESGSKVPRTNPKSLLLKTNLPRSLLLKLLVRRNPRSVGKNLEGVLRMGVVLETGKSADKTSCSILTK